MKIFIIHRGKDSKKVERFKKQIQQTIDVDLLALESDPDNQKWFKEAKVKIDRSDLILFALGKHTHESENVDKEILYALKRKKQILLYRLNPKSDDKINRVLFRRDDYTNTDKPLFKEIELDDLVKIFRYGYSFDVQDKLNDTNLPKRENELIEQYKAYLATSEDVLTRRQNTSNFYTTLNASMLTMATTVSGIMLGIPALNNSLLVVSLIFFPVSVVGILLNINWISLLESYGRLNSAKIRVISEMEKNLPANIYDTEWKVMSERLGSKSYVSFTAIEKRLPMFFIALFGILACVSIVMFGFAVYSAQAAA